MELSRRKLLSGLTLAAVAGQWRPARAAEDLQAAIDAAQQGDGVLRLGARSYESALLRITGALRIEGVPGRTRIVSISGGPVLEIAEAADVSLAGLIFAGTGAGAPRDGALVTARGISGLTVTDCDFGDTPLTALRLEGCSGRIVHNCFHDIGAAALFSLDARGLLIEGNDVADVGDNGIQVWASEPREDGTLVTGNRISRIAARSGGSGQNGNGINVFRAGNVTVSGNRISDCAFSAVRNNAGSGCQITGNSVSRMGEVAIYCEFGFEGAVVSGNQIETARHGISITNFNEGGRLAVCAGNVIRDAQTGGISAEADTTVMGNVIEGARGNGITLGWGGYSRNLLASGNILRDCGRGIAFSLAAGAGPAMISGNRIDGSHGKSIVGMEHDTELTGDLGTGEVPLPLQRLIAGNFVS